MAIQGMRDTSNFVTNERKGDWRLGLMMLYPNGIAPLYALTAAIKNEKAVDPEFSWWEKSMQDRRFALGADLDNTGGSEDITIASGGLTLKAGDLLLVEQTNEILHVNSTPTVDTTVNVLRSWGSVAATAVTYNGNGVNPSLLLIGSAYEEGSASPDGVSYDPVKKRNYTQIFRNNFELTNTAIKTQLRTADAVKEAKRECLELHSRDIEMALWFGEAVESTKNGKPVRTTGGIKSFIPSSNQKAVASNTLTMDALEGYLEDIFRYGSNEKMGFCGNRALTAINQAVRKNTAYQIQNGVKEYGMNVTRLTTPYGELVLKTHPLFNQVVGGTTGTADYYSYNSALFVLDMKNLVYRYLDGRNTQYLPDQQSNGLDGMKSGYLTECGLEVHHGETHFLLTGLNAGAADA